MAIDASTEKGEYYDLRELYKQRRQPTHLRRFHQPAITRTCQALRHETITYYYRERFTWPGLVSYKLDQELRSLGGDDPLLWIGKLLRMAGAQRRKDILKLNIVFEIGSRKLSLSARGLRNRTGWGISIDVEKVGECFKATDVSRRRRRNWQMYRVKF